MDFNDFEVNIEIILIKFCDFFEISSKNDQILSFFLISSLSHLCNVTIQLQYTSNQIKSWTNINRRNPAPTATPKRSSEVPQHVELAMWKHLCANANRINNGIQANSIKFWREMKMSKEDEENVSMTDIVML